MEQNESFEYTYSAKQQEELEQIRKKYLPPEEDKMALIRKLDREVTKKGSIYAITIGLMGSLVFGSGLSCVLILGVDSFIYGIPLGLLGIILCGLAYPLYLSITKKEKERIAPKILALIEEMKQ